MQYALISYALQPILAQMGAMMTGICGAALARALYTAHLLPPSRGLGALRPTPAGRPRASVGRARRRARGPSFRDRSPADASSTGASLRPWAGDASTAQAESLEATVVVMVMHRKAWEKILWYI